MEIIIILLIIILVFVIIVFIQVAYLAIYVYDNSGEVKQESIDRVMKMATQVKNLIP